jgi:hypothetical protein
MNSQYPGCIKLLELEALAAAGMLEDFSAEEDELFWLRSQPKSGGDSDDL